VRKLVIFSWEFLHGWNRDWKLVPWSDVSSEVRVGNCTVSFIRRTISLIRDRLLKSSPYVENLVLDFLAIRHNVPSTAISRVGKNTGGTSHCEPLLQSYHSVTAPSTRGTATPGSIGMYDTWCPGLEPVTGRHHQSGTTMTWPSSGSDWLRQSQYVHSWDVLAGSRLAQTWLCDVTLLARETSRC